MLVMLWATMPSEMIEAASDEGSARPPYRVFPWAMSFYPTQDDKGAVASISPWSVTSSLLGFKPRVLSAYTVRST